MKQFILKALAFLRIIEGEGSLSLSNVAVIIVVVKMALSHSLDLSSAAALLTVLSGYNFKRYINSKKVIAPAKLPEDEVAGLKAEINKLKLRMGFIPGADRN